MLLVNKLLSNGNSKSSLSIDSPNARWVTACSHWHLGGSTVDGTSITGHIGRIWSLMTPVPPFGPDLYTVDEVDHNFNKSTLTSFLKVNILPVHHVMWIPVPKFLLWRDFPPPCSQNWTHGFFIIFGIFHMDMYFSSDGWVQMFSPNVPQTYTIVRTNLIPDHRRKMESTWSCSVSVHTSNPTRSHK